MRSLKEYVDAMPESQKAIYYASADTVKHAMALPQCEEVRSRGYEILYLDHPIDETVLQQLRMYEGKGFVNILTEDLGFQTDEEKKAAEEKVVENKELLDFIRDSIGDEKQAGNAFEQARFVGMLPDLDRRLHARDGKILPQRPERGDAQAARRPRA